MSKRRSTREIQEIVQIAHTILAEEQQPMTLRQTFYQLVARQVLQNTQREYSKLSRYLVDARKRGVVPWDWLEDRTRYPRKVSQWESLGHFAETAKAAYRRDVWETQERYIEVWCEKDALSGIFESELRPYGVTLNIGKGYDGWSSIYSAATRYRDKGSIPRTQSNPTGQKTIILYFGDFDPSGVDIERSLCDRLFELDCEPGVVRCALTLEDVEQYHLPPQMTKKSDSRSAKHIAKYGEQSSIELDALPANVLRERIRAEIERYMDMDALAEIKAIEREERMRLVDALNEMA